jgi:3-oxoacyl-[acyl-carrier protein] reductase
MGDFLLEVGKNPKARRLIKSLGLPIPLPERLRREQGPWGALPLKDRPVMVGAAPGAEVLSTLAVTLAAAGADPFVAGPESQRALFKDPGETFGRPARGLDALKEGARVDALVFDASGVASAVELREVYAFFHAQLGRLSRSGRVVVVGRPLAGASPEEAAARAALEGFVRSVAKEIGRTGSTANLVRVERGSEGRLPGVLRFLLSARSAFVTAQPLVVTSRAKGGVEPAFVRALDRKVALVTGAARGIGNATARALALEGAHVVCLDRLEDDGPTSQLAREIGGTPLLVDMAGEDAPLAIAEALRGKGGVDVIVHNAGITRDKTLARMSAAQWDQVIAVNLDALVRTTAALEDSVLKDGGRIICLSSVAGIAGNVGQAAYAATKAGVIGYVEALAARLAGRGITANAVAPGFIETRLTAAIPFAIREAGRRMAALGQGGLPEDVAEVIAFLASPGAQGITGRTLRVCGGSLIGA